MAILHWENSTAEAVAKILKHLAESSFAEKHGTEAVKGLQDYRLDLAVDIWTAWFDRPPTNVELADLQRIVDEKLGLV